MSFSNAVEHISRHFFLLIIVHENQPTLNSNSTPTRMFLRRRIVLLTLALILAIVIITVTIVGLLISSYNDRYMHSINIQQEETSEIVPLSQFLQSLHSYLLKKIIIIIKIIFKILFLQSTGRGGS